MRDWLKQVRLLKGKTMKDVAEHIGITEAAYCMIENNKRQSNTMYIKTAVKLSEVLDVSMEQIVQWEMQ